MNLFRKPPSPNSEAPRIDVRSSPKWSVPGTPSQPAPVDSVPTKADEMIRLMAARRQDHKKD